MNAIPNKYGNWLGGGLIAASAVALVAGMIHLSGHAPIGLVSLGAGLGLGAALGTLARRLKIAMGKWMILATVLLACFAVLEQHMFVYSDFRRQWRDSRSSPQVALFRDQQPPSPVSYFTLEATPGRVAFWCLDGALIVAGAVGMVLLMGRVSANSAAAPTRSSSANS